VKVLQSGEGEFIMPDLDGVRAWMRDRKPRALVSKLMSELARKMSAMSGDIQEGFLNRDAFKSIDMEKKLDEISKLMKEGNIEKAMQMLVFTIIGGRSKELVILESEMQVCSDQVFVTTDDGSYGQKGIVTDPLRQLLSDPQKGIKAVYAIGPLPMMRAVANLTKEFGVHTLVSLNAIMVDGTGMCGGCRVTIDGKMKFACVDGPEFDAHQVDFDELILRNRSYVDFERTSVEKFSALQASAQEGAR